MAGQRGRRVLLIEHYHARRREDPHLAAAAAATSPTSTRARRTTCRRTRISAAPRSRATRRATSSRWSSGTASRATRRSSASSSATAARIDDHRDAARRVRARPASSGGMPCPVDGVDARGRRVRRRDAAGGRPVRRRWWSPPAASRCRRSARRRSATGSPSSSGCAVVPPRPALVPLAFAPDALARFGDLAGVVARRRGGVRRRRAFASICCSRIADCRGRRSCRSRRTGTASTPLRSTCCPASMPTAWLVAERDGAARLDHLLAARLPRRFAQAWCAAHDVARPVRELPERRVRDDRRGRCIAGRCCRPGRSGCNKAEVTLGGVDTRALSSKTMAATCGARAALHRRGRRRHRLARRLQLPVGVGVGPRGGAGGLRARAFAGAPVDPAARRAPLPRAFPGAETTGEPRFGLAFRIVRNVSRESSLMFRFLSLAVTALLLASGAAVAQVKIGLMVSATGPTTAIGMPQKNTGDLLPTRIGDASRSSTSSYDDGGDTTRARAERQEAPAGAQRRRADRPVDDARSRSRSSTSSPRPRSR